MKLLSQKVSIGEKVGYSLGDGSANLVFQIRIGHREELCGSFYNKSL